MTQPSAATTLLGPGVAMSSWFDFDSVYQHVLAWHEAMAAVGIELAVWSIHRRIGMSGGLMANAILRETGRAVTPEDRHLRPGGGTLLPTPTFSSRRPSGSGCRSATRWWVGDSVWDLLAARRARALGWACSRAAMGRRS